MNSALTDWICAGNTSNENSPKMLMCLSIRSDCACNTQDWPLDCSHSDQKNATNRKRSSNRAMIDRRSEERRVGKESGRTGKFRWSTHHTNKKNRNNTEYN